MTQDFKMKRDELCDERYIDRRTKPNMVPSERAAFKSGWNECAAAMREELGKVREALKLAEHILKHECGGCDMETVAAAQAILENILK